ncbi:porin [Paraburkholderia xenovorans]|uniref:porin n=1 Tax=Paraburkholderia xenovorans TaxID=36873 RepID=UPI0038BDEDBF
MKQKLSVIIIGGSAAIMASGTNAQSSVSLYGLIDTGFSYVSNVAGARQYELTACNASGCRLGFKGTEDLGGNLRVIFTFENGFNPLNGKIKDGGTFLGRRAFVGLEGDWGSVTFGRQYPTISDFVGKFESGGDWAAAGIGYGEHPDDVDNLNSSYRFNNSVKFTSVDYAGFSFGGLYSLGGVAGRPSENQIISFAASFSNGPFKIAAGYQGANNPNYSVFGTDANASATGNNAPSNILAGYASARSQQVLAVGTSYTIGKATLGAVYSNVSFRNLGGTPVSKISLSNLAIVGIHISTQGKLISNIK